MAQEDTDNVRNRVEVFFMLMDILRVIQDGTTTIKPEYNDIKRSN
jgi:hypothetical protein